MRNRSALLFGGAAAIAVLYSLFGEVGILATLKMRRTQKELAAENSRLREENGRLREEVLRLRSNPAYIEEIARRELGLIGEKENVIVLDRKKDVPPSPAPSRDGTRR